MRKFLILFLFAFTAHFTTHAQIANDYMVGLGADLIKTDNDGFFKKVQAGAEFNYFLHKRFTVTGAFEVWTDDEISFVLGGRWYPVDEFFIRGRGFVGANDLALGAGWVKPLGESFRFEVIGDFYFKGQFAIRTGISYVIRKKMTSRL
jgi:hypothetical protein